MELKSKKKAKTIRKGREKRTSDFFILRKKRDKTAHNRGPTERSYYWGTGLLMDYHLEKMFGCNVLIRF